MAEFLTGQEITRYFLSVLHGKDLRCAESSWSREVAADFRVACADFSQTRVVCSLSAGECTPESLLELGAPRNTRLKHFPGLSASVWLSDFGLLVRSGSCLKSQSQAACTELKTLQAATYHRAGSATWRAAAAWFERLYEGATSIDIEAIEVASSKCTALRRVAEWKVPEQGSLIDFLNINPERFDDFGFVITSKVSTEKERSEARKSAYALPSKKDTIDNLPGEGILTGWKKADVLRCPSNILEFRMIDLKLKIIARKIQLIDPDSGTVFTKRDTRLFNHHFLSGCPSFEEAQRRDAPRIRLLRDEGVSLFCNATQFTKAVFAL